MELIHRGPSRADYLLKYVMDDSYCFSDLLPEDIFNVKARLTNGSLHKFLLSDIIEAYGLMTGRDIVSKPILVEFLKEGILNRTNTQLTTTCIWVSLDVGANELKPFIDNAFRESRVDLDVITQDDMRKTFRELRLKPSYGLKSAIKEMVEIEAS